MRTFLLLYHCKLATTVLLKTAKQMRSQPFDNIDCVDLKRNPSSFIKANCFYQNTNGQELVAYIFIFFEVVLLEITSLR